MAGENKNLEIGVVVNEGQMSKFNRAIQDATREVNKLAEALNRASSTFKGFLSGAGVSGGSGMTFRAGSGFAKSPMMAGAGIGQPALGVANAIKSVTKESTDSFRSLDQTVRTTSGKMAASLSPLDHALANIEKRFKNIKGFGTGVMLPKGHFDPFAEGGSGSANFAPGGSGGGGVTATIQRLMANNGIGRQFLTGVAGGRVGNGLANLIGNAAPIGVPIAAGVLALSAGFGLSAAGTRSQVANDQYILAERNQELARRAAYGSTFGGAAMGIRGGDIALSAAWGKALHDSRAMSTATNQDAKRVLQINAAQHYWGGGSQEGVNKFGSGWRNLVHEGLWGGIKTELRDAKGRLTNEARWLYDKVAGNKGNRYDTAEEVQFKQSYNAVTTDKLAATAATADALYRSDPRYNSILNTVYGSAMGRVGASRIGGVGGGPIKTGQYKGQDVLDVMDMLATRRGYDMQTQQQSYRSMGQAAGWGLRGSLGLSANDMQAGGFSGIESLFNLGSQYGGGRAGGMNLYNMIQKTVGSGGLDTVAASGLFSSFASQAQASGQFGFGTDITPGLQAAAAAASGGSTGQDMRNASAMQRGMALWRQQTSGGLDPLQQALNTRAANEAFSGRGFAVKQLAMGMDPTLRMSIMAGGKVPSYFSSLYPQGTNDKTVRSELTNFFEKGMRANFSRNFTAYGGVGNDNSYTSQIMNEVFDAQGNWKSVLRSHMKQKGHKSLTDELSTLAGPMSLGMGTTPEDAYGALRAQVGTDRELAPFLHGSGAHGPRIAERDKTSLRTQSDMKEADAKDLAEKFLKTVLEDIKNAAKNYKALDSAGHAGGGAAEGADLGALNKALGAYSTQIGEYTKQLAAAVDAIKAIAPQ